MSKELKEFRAIEGFENYEISEDGKVRSVTTKKYYKIYTDAKKRNMVVLRKDEGWAECHYISDLIGALYGVDAGNKYAEEHNQEPFTRRVLIKEDPVEGSSTVTSSVKVNKRCRRLRCVETGETFKSYAEAAKHYNMTYDKFYDGIYSRGKVVVGNKTLTFEKLNG